MDHSSPNGSLAAHSNDPYEENTPLRDKRRRSSCQGHAAPTSLPKPQTTDDRPPRDQVPQLMPIEPALATLAPATPQSLSPREAERCSPSASPEDSSPSSADSADIGGRGQSLTPPTLTDPKAMSLRELLSRDRQPQSAPQQHTTSLTSRRPSHRSATGCTSVPTETLTCPEAEALQRRHLSWRHQGSPSVTRSLRSSFDIALTSPRPGYRPPVSNSMVFSPPMASARSTHRRHTIDGIPEELAPLTKETVTTSTAHIRNSHGQRMSVSVRKREVMAAANANASQSRRTRNAHPPKPHHHHAPRERRSKQSSSTKDIKHKASEVMGRRERTRKEGNGSKAAAAADQDEAGNLFSIPGIVDAVTSVFSQFINPCECSVGGSPCSEPSSRNK